MFLEFEGGKSGKKLEDETKVELLARAKKYNIVGRHKMRKADLIAELRKKYQEIGSKLSKRRK